MTAWSIAAAEPLEADVVLAMLAAHAVPGVESCDQAAGQHRRLLSLRSGPAAVSVGVERAGVRVEIDSTEPAVRAQVDARVRRWFDLDADLGPVRRVLAADPRLAPLVAARPGLRVLEYPDPVEAAVMAVLGQQVSVAAARTFGGRLVTAYGAPHPSGLTAFPTPQRLVAAEPEELRAAVGVTRARGRTLQAVARAFLEHAGDGTPTRAQLLALPGVGPWTADYLAVRSAGDRDAFTPGDLVLRRALGRIDTRAAAARAEVWRPYRAYALFHLWVAAAYLP